MMRAMFSIGAAFSCLIATATAHAADPPMQLKILPRLLLRIQAPWTMARGQTLRLPLSERATLTPPSTSDRPTLFATPQASASVGAKTPHWAGIAPGSAPSLTDEVLSGRLAFVHLFGSGVCITGAALDERNLNQGDVRVQFRPNFGRPGAWVRATVAFR